MGRSKSQTLVLHADDFGMNPAVNEGVVQGFSHGLLTSTSVLANSPACPDAISRWSRLEADRIAGSLPSRAARSELGDPSQPFDLGVHLNLTQGRPLSRSFPGELLDKDGCFVGVFRLFFLLRSRPERFQDRLRAELAEQVSLVCDYGLTPTHVNGHQYIEMFPAIAGLLPGLMARFAIPMCRLARERPAMPGWKLWRWPAWFLACAKHRFAVRLANVLAQAEVLYLDGFRGASHAGRVDLRTMAGFVSSVARCSTELVPCGRAETLSSRRTEQVPFYARAALETRTTTEIALHPGLPPRNLGETPRGWHDPLHDLRPSELALLTSPELFSLLMRRDVRLGRLAPPARPLSAAAASAVDSRTAESARM